MPALFERYFEPTEACVLREPDERTRLILLPCSNPYTLSRKLAAIKGGNRLAYDALPQADLEALRAGRKKLVIDTGGEVFPTRVEMIDGMHEGLSELGIRRAQAAIVCGDLNATGNYLRFCATRGIADPVTLLSSSAPQMFFLAHQRMTPETFRQYAADTRRRREQRRDKKLFLSFNGRSRTHRFYAVLLLMAHGLLDRGFVSLLDYAASPTGTTVQSRDAAEVARTAQQLRSWLANWPMAELCLPYCEKLIASLPLELDLSAEDAVSNRRYRERTGWEMQDLSLYERSYVSLVTDSMLPNDDVLFVTEKPLKAFIGLHPFIYIGCRGALARLRSYGFQTFHPHIDESYDDEPHGPSRLVKAIGELRRLAALAPHELDELSDALWPRLLHNARHACVDAAAWGKAKLDAEIRAPLLAFGND